MIAESLYSRRAIFADICRRARGDVDWKGYQPVAFENKKTDTQWYFLDLPYAHVFVFRGTEPDNPRDWATDLMFRKKVLPYGNTKSKIRVHRGFLRAYKSVREKVHEIAKQFIVHPKPVLILGHSLGGALATLCAVDIQYNMREGDLQDVQRNVYVFTFGSPRVGNRAFAQSYRRRIKRTWRYWGSFDIVAAVPPTFFGYQHVTKGFGLRCRHDIRKYMARLGLKP